MTSHDVAQLPELLDRHERREPGSYAHVSRVNHRPHLNSRQRRGALLMSVHREERAQSETHQKKKKKKKTKRGTVVESKQGAVAARARTERDA